jgi:hypothetical protein
MRSRRGRDRIVVGFTTAHGRWFSPASSTSKTDRHDIAEILLKVALKHQNIIKSINYFFLLQKL